MMDLVLRQCLDQRVEALSMCWPALMDKLLHPNELSEEDLVQAIANLKIAEELPTFFGETFVPNLQCSSWKFRQSN